MSIPNKARVAQVFIGSIVFEGVMLPNGDFAITLSQLRDLAFPSVSQNNAIRELKAACGKDFQLTKVSTEISNNPQWIVPIDQLNYCLTELAFRGHKESRDLVRVLSGLSLQQLFCDAFGQKFEAADRQAWLQSRVSGKNARRSLTDAINSYVQRHPELPKKTKDYIYATTTDNTYKALFGVSSKVLKETRGVKNLRDNMTMAEINAIDTVEGIAQRLIDIEDVSPIRAMLIASERALLTRVFLGETAKAIIAFNDVLALAEGD
jgi:hypothetical protein